MVDQILENTTIRDVCDGEEDFSSVKNACVLMNQSKANQPAKRKAKKGDGKPKGNKKKKGNAAAKPAFAKCADCNKSGHVAGDANCKKP